MPELSLNIKTLALVAALLFVALDVAEIYWGNYEADLAVHSGLSDAKLFEYATKVKKNLLIAPRCTTHQEEGLVAGSGRSGPPRSLSRSLIIPTSCGLLLSMKPA